MSIKFFLCMMFAGIAYPKTPVWTFQPNLKYPPKVTVQPGDVASIVYTITNQSHRTHTLSMQAIKGIDAYGCTKTLGYLQTCDLKLVVNGNNLDHDIIGGPLLCEQGNTNQCYQPNSQDSLNIHFDGSPVTQYVVTSSAGSNGTIAPLGRQTVKSGGSITFKATPFPGYQVDQWILDGNAQPVFGDFFSLTNITSDHTLYVSFAQATQFTVYASAGPNGSIVPNGPQTVPSNSTIIFTATPNLNYQIDKWTLDGNIVQNGGTTYTLNNINKSYNITVSFSPQTQATLTPSLSTLALSINCSTNNTGCTSTSDPAMTGHTRTITISNTGSNSATNLAVNSSGLPSDATVLNNCTNTLNGQSSCTIDIVPGSLATSDCTQGSAPLPGEINVTADGGLSTKISIVVLGYGCRYQGGFIYAIDDTTNVKTSIAGRVVSAVNQASMMIWSSNATNSDPLNVSYDTIPGIGFNVPVTFQDFSAFFSNTYTNTNPFDQKTFSDCNLDTNPSCDAKNILIYYKNIQTNFNAASSPKYTATLKKQTDSKYYAAGSCTSIINGYSDWYLPNICEMGATCNSNIQNINNALQFLIGNPNSPNPSSSCNPPPSAVCLVGYYWSANEASNPQQYAMAAYFEVNNSQFISTDKKSQYGVRCARAF